jgi:hypothetical protein
MTNNLCKLALQANGSIQPLFFNSTESGHTGLTNPSILIDGKDFYINLRNVQYALYHSEYGQNFQNHWGCLAYLNPEDDITLRTRNFLSKNNYYFKKIDTSKLDAEPLWEFIGLEDGRLVKWDDKLFLCGVRRDTTTNGVGRMELSELRDTGYGFAEINRYRIEPPKGYTYCEKNWMPILDMPFHFVKWTNPTEVVKVDISTLKSETIVLKEQKIPIHRDLRGGSQVVAYKDYYVAITHEVDLWMNSKNNKDAHYYHRFIVWDKNWNIVKYSDEFKFMNAKIEFSCGLAHQDGRFLITFGYQDNTAFLLEMTDDCFESFIDRKNDTSNITLLQKNKLHNFIGNTESSITNFELGLDYFNEGHYASAMTFFLRCAELEHLCSDVNKLLVYNALILVSECLGRIGRRKASQKTALLNAVAYLPNRYEAHYLLSQWYEQEQDFFNCFASANTALVCFQQDSSKLVPFMLDVEEYKIKFQIAYCAWWVGRFDYSRKTFFEISNEYGMSMDDKYQTLVQNNITRLGSGDKFLTYTSNHLENYVYKFKDIEKIERNYSQTYQDMFVLYMANGKANGTYIEIGSADPEYGSNTKLLESKFDWKGVGIEILQEEVIKHNNSRKNPVICKNALEIDYKELLTRKSKEFDNNGFFDYLQVDCEPPSVSFDILKMIPFDEFKFGVVTFEHDYYADLTKSIRQESREYMRSKGYILVVGNVSMNDDCPYEDWWVHKDYKASSRIMNVINDDSQVVNMEKFMFQHK